MPKASLTLATIIAATSALLAPAAAHAESPGASAAAQQTTVTDYGPYTVQSGSSTGNQPDFNVPAPCHDCYITGIEPELVHSDGTSANLNTGAMLHHFVMASRSRADATCDSSQRFFASGNERTDLALPTGHGYHVGRSDTWDMLVDIMNMSSVERTFFLRLTYHWQPASAALEPVTPVWLDIDQCGDSEYAIPAGRSDAHWDWTVNVPGRVVAVSGHLHDGGVRIEATNETAGGASICDSTAGYGETPGYIDPSGKAHLSSMSTCAAQSLADLRQGDLVRIHSIYDSPEPQTDVMGIMLAYIAAN